MGARALVLDFGGPVLLTPFELVSDRAGTPVHAVLSGRGPLATAGHPDPDWAEVQEGRVTERAYWTQRAREWHGAGGNGPAIPAMMAHLYEPPRPQLVREQARALMRDARVAGHPVAILTNDLRAFHSQAWVDEIEIVGDVDVLVDGSVEGYLKPDRRLYEILADRLGVDFVDMVFLDDQMTNIRGAEALGIPSVWFDPAAPEAGFAAVRILLGLPEEEPHG